MQREELAMMQEKLIELETHNKKVIGNLDVQKEEISEIKKTVEGHDKILESYGKKIENLAEDILKIENVIVQENKETRIIMQEMLNKLWDLIMSRDIAKGAFTNKIVDSFFKMFQVGGIIYLLADKILNP